MSCNVITNCSCDNSKDKCRCTFNTKQFGIDDLERINLDGADRATLNWSEISVPEILNIPIAKPDIEHLDQIFVDAEINCAKLIETPFAYKSYDRLATDIEIAATQDVVTAGQALTIADITTTFDALMLAAPNIPQKVAVQNAYNTVMGAFASFTTALGALNTLLADPTLTAAELVDGIESVINSLEVLIAAVTALRVAAVALGVAAPAVAAEVTALVAAIDAFLISANTVLGGFESVIVLIGNTKYLELTPNAENTYLTGRKIIVEGSLKQKIVYTGLVLKQSVHSAHFTVPFTAFVVPYASFENLTYQENVLAIDPDTGDEVTINGFSYNPDEEIIPDLCEDFCVEAFVEDIFGYALDSRTVFKNITLFLQAKTTVTC